jgi:hypothetical protein
MFKKTDSEKLYTIASSFVLLLPAFFAFETGLEILGVILCVLTVVSSIYHYYKPHGHDWWWNHDRSKKQTFLLYLDTLLSLSVFVFMTWYLYVKSIDFTDVVGVLIFLGGLYLLLSPRGDYKMNHFVWHLIAATAPLLVLI